MAESNSRNDNNADLELIREAAVEAGRIAMRFFAKEHSNEVWTKSGNSPVSEADFAVDAFLKDHLLGLRPDYGWLSEETEDNQERLSSRRIFVVDPIDGTRGFLEGRPEWCISIAVVEAQRPVAGVLECPALDRSFSAQSGGGALLNATQITALSGDKLKTVTASRKLNALMEEKYRSSLRVYPFVPSLAYRIAMVANGEIDAAFARPGAHDWDLAAAEVILSEVGGKLTGTDGRVRLYNQDSPRSGSLLACGQGVHQKLMDLAKTDGFLH